MASNCAGASRGPSPKTTPAAPTGVPAWLTLQPEGCSLGGSGPTLRPTDAIREAHRRARASLVSSLEKVRNKSASSTRVAEKDAQHREVILEESDGWVRNAQVVAMWYDERGIGPNGAAGTAYAVACLPGHSPRGDDWMKQVESSRTAPSWIYGNSRHPRLCAVGISGPTLEPRDAERNAETAGRDGLAEAIAVKVKSATLIFENNEVLYGAVTDVPEPCREQARRAKVEASWTDREGAGPIPHAGTAYALLCAD